MTLYDAEYLSICTNGYCTVDINGSGNYLFVDPTISNSCNDILDLTLCILAKCTINANICN